MSPGTIWVFATIIVFAVCGTGIVLCREIMLEEVQRRLPEGQKISYPYLSWKYPEIVRLHAQYYPESRIRAASRFLKVLALTSIGTLGLGALVIVIVRSAQKDAPAPPTVTGFECPKYPSDAESMRLQGTVKLQVTTDGHQVVDVKLLSGHPVLARAAIKNVHTWKFAEASPTTFTVIYVYADEGIYKRDPITKCSAKMELPTHVTVSTKF